MAYQFDQIARASRDGRPRCRRISASDTNSAAARCACGNPDWPRRSKPHKRDRCGRRASPAYRRHEPAPASDRDAARTRRRKSGATRTAPSPTANPPVAAWCTGRKPARSTPVVGCMNTMTPRRAHSANSGSKAASSSGRPAAEVGSATPVRPSSSRARLDFGNGEFRFSQRRHRKAAMAAAGLLHEICGLLVQPAREGAVGGPVRHG